MKSAMSWSCTVLTLSAWSPFATSVMVFPIIWAPCRRNAAAPHRCGPRAARAAPRAPRSASRPPSPDCARAGPAPAAPARSAPRRLSGGARAPRGTDRTTGPSAWRTARSPSSGPGSSTTPRSTDRGTASTAPGARASRACGRRAWRTSGAPGPGPAARTRSGPGGSRQGVRARGGASTPGRTPRPVSATSRRADWASSPSLPSVSREPAGDLRPAVTRGPPPGDERDVAAGQLDVLLVTAADDVDERAHARGRSDVVFLGTDDVDRAGDVLEAHRAAAHDELAPVELVLLVEVAHPLPEELAREGDVLVRPPVERLETLHVLVVPEVPPEVEVRGQVHGRLDELEPGTHQVGRDAAERVHEAVDVEVLLLEPEAKEADLREVDRARHVDEVPDGDLGARRDERRRDGRAHAVAEHGELRRPRALEDLRGHLRQDLRHAVLDREVVVLGPEDAPVEQVEVESLARHVLDEAPAREEVEDVRPADPEVRDEQERGRVAP